MSLNAISFILQENGRFQMMRVDANTHNYDKSTINVVSSKIFYITAELGTEIKMKKWACTAGIRAFDVNHKLLTQNSMLAGIKFRN